MVEATRRVAHVLGALNVGGAETWLLNVAGALKGTISFDFIVNSETPGVYDQEVIALGGRVFTCTGHRSPLVYSQRLKQILGRYGPFSAVHSHVHFYSGVVLRVANTCEIPVRIAHSHLAQGPTSGTSGWRRLYMQTMRFLIERYATKKLAVSYEAGQALFGRREFMILRCGIDTSQFGPRPSSRDLRRELGIPRSAFVIGHVGRFDEQKNHKKLIEIGAEAVRIQPNVMLLLVGIGPLMDRVRSAAKRKGISDRVVFAGLRRDVPVLLRDVVDVFVFPSLYEGLPVALIEAQAAGVPCIVSTAVSKESAVLAEAVAWCDVSAPALTWAELALRFGSGGCSLDRETALRRIAESPFGIAESARNLVSVYQNAS